MARRTPARLQAGTSARLTLTHRAHRLGIWHITLTQDKGATFGGHPNVVGPTVLFQSTLKYLAKSFNNNLSPSVLTSTACIHFLFDLFYLIIN